MNPWLNRTLTQIKRFSRQFRATRVLIVEDDATLRPFLERLLIQVSESDCKVDWASSGSQALMQLQQSRYDLIILDLQLEGNLTGLDLWEHCQRSHKDSVVYLMSSTSEELVTNQVRDPEIHEYFLSKPLLASDCREKFTSVLSEGDR